MNETNATKRKQAKEALSYIIPVLSKYGFHWVITGGFAAYVYGVDRPITDIDIDIDVSKDDDTFKQFLTEVGPYLTQPLEHFVDQNYDNYNFEITIAGVVIDICPMRELKVFNKDTGSYEFFYGDGYPASETVDFEGMKLPLLARELIIRNKEMLPFQRDSDRDDITGLKKLMSS